MKDRDNVLRRLDEIDNMIMVMHQSIERNNPINPMDAKMRFANIRKMLKFVTDRVTAS